MNFKTDYLEIGSVPVFEEFSTPDYPSYEVLSRIETTAFKHQMNKTYPDGDFLIKKNEKGLRIVVAIIDVPEDEKDCTMTKRTTAGFYASEDIPEYWTPESLDFLKSNNYFELFEENKKCTS